MSCPRTESWRDWNNHRSAPLLGCNRLLFWWLLMCRKTLQQSFKCLFVARFAKTRFPLKEREEQWGRRGLRQHREAQLGRGQAGGPSGCRDTSSRITCSAEVLQPAGKGHPPPSPSAARRCGRGASCFARQAAACWLPGYFHLRALGPRVSPSRCKMKMGSQRSGHIKIGHSNKDAFREQRSPRRTRRL